MGRYRGHHEYVFISVAHEKEDITDALPCAVYQPIIFQLAGFDASKAGWVSGVNTITYMFSTYAAFRRDLLTRMKDSQNRSCSLICVFTLDRIGRRVTLFWGESSRYLLTPERPVLTRFFDGTGGGVQAFALIMAGVFVHLLKVHPEKTAEYGAAATFMVFLVRS